MKRAFFFLVVLMITSIVTLAQDKLLVAVRNGILRDTVLEELDERGFEFKFHCRYYPSDTCEIEMVHGRGNVRLSRITYRLCEDDSDFIKYSLPSLRPGDVIVFYVTVGRKKYSERYYVASTREPLRKPFYIDLYFTYNGDTISTKKFFVLHTTKITRKEDVDHIRWFFSDPKDLPTKVRLVFRISGDDFIYDFPARGVLHGKALFRYSDNEKEHPEQRKHRRKTFYKCYTVVTVIDMDSGEKRSMTKSLRPVFK
ncbi:hypothetical protein SAMN04488109_5150 [Chryseolinea serpens]|uniref:Uncharacterized protein n=1 Tax=Chryseolinea serpens TaxID=947013 RepID=A0A1M5VJ75_9BACT|nr:hypothetical protein [Chryseolinea serpens]SHH75309.1 hypothetical protein SAMN04488109_5150 [Chryseolinea serpens]